MSDYGDNERRNWVKNKKAYIPEFKHETMKEIKSYKSLAWPERNIRQDIMEKFGVKLLQSESDQTTEKVFFPYYGQDNKLCGYKVKDCTVHKKEKGHHYTVGHVGVDCKLFGQNQARIGAKFLFNCEGEPDTLSAYQALVDFNQRPGQSEKFKNLTPAVTGIGCGTPNAVDHIAHNEEFLKNFEEVRLCYDNDEVSELDKKKKKKIDIKGKEATEAVGNHLLNHKVRIVEWPDGMNDCSDYLQEGKSMELAQQLLFKTKKYSTAKIVSLYDVFREGDLYKPMEKGVYLDSFPKLMDRWLGVRMREATLVLAPSGIGKSSVTAEIGYNFAEKEGGVGGIFLEEGMKKTCNRFIARKLKIHPNLYKFDQHKYCTYDEYLKAEQWVANPDHFMFIDHYGPIKIDDLIDLARIFIYKYGRKFIALDHISLTVTGDGNVDERVELEKAMVSLTTLCEQCDVHIMVVAHINRGSSVVSGSDRNFDKPKWKRTFITDGKGTQALEALAHNIIPIDVELLPDGTRGRIRLFLGKNREADNLGFCDITRMDDKTGVFYDASNEVWQPKGSGY